METVSDRTWADSLNEDFVMIMILVWHGPFCILHGLVSLYYSSNNEGVASVDAKRMGIVLVTYGLFWVFILIPRL